MQQHNASAGDCSLKRAIAIPDDIWGKISVTAGRFKARVTLNVDRGFYAEVHRVQILYERNLPVP
jgi:hypothetical protein